MENNISLFRNIRVFTLAVIYIFILEIFTITGFGELDFFDINNNSIVAILFNEIMDKPSTLSPLFYFLFVQLAMHVLFILYNYNIYQFFKNLISPKSKTGPGYLTSKPISKKMMFDDGNGGNTNNKQSKSLATIGFFLLISFNYLLILIINYANYPYSVFALDNIISNQFILNLFSNKYIFLFAINWLTLGLIISLINVFKNNFKSNNILFILLLSLLAFIIYPTIKNSFIFSASNNNKNTNNPNIVLITMDSFRHDYIDQLNPIYNKYLDITSFVNQSVLFDNSYTPLARSFPSLYSILSGTHPKEGNIRFNLANQDNISFDKLLPSILKDNGYETLYTTDSNQFHIINKDWGYKYLATPKQGIYEQILPRINDLPLSNLIINHQISSVLFPYTFSNPSAGRTYNPISYVNRIYNSMDSMDHSKPLFMHLNFEAAHWPYQNRDLNSSQTMFQERYKLCLNTINWQTNQIFKYLTKNKLLNNAVVILASDHGESLSISNDKLTNLDNYIGDSKYLDLINKHPVNYTFAEIDNITKYNNKTILDVILDINTSGGHGVDVLSNSQYKTVLAIQKFSNTKPDYDSNIISSPVIISDLYPTILDLSNLDNYKNQVKNNLSLVPLLSNQYINNQEVPSEIKGNNKTNSNYKDYFNDRNIFVETGLQVPFFTTNELKNKNIMNSFITSWMKKYYINNKQILELKNESIDGLLKTKQLAVINKNNVLAYIPTGLKQNWKVVLEENKEQDKTVSCDIPRQVSDQNGTILATLCGYYADTPGYFVFYNGDTGKWLIYPNENIINTNGNTIAQKMLMDLKGYYDSEIGVV